MHGSRETGQPCPHTRKGNPCGRDGWMDGWISDGWMAGLDGIERWMDEWMDARQGHRATHACMHLLSVHDATRPKAAASLLSRLRCQVLVEVHSKVWIGFLMYELSCRMQSFFFLFRQRPQRKFRSPTFIAFPIVSVRLIMPTLIFNAAIRFCHPGCWAENLTMIPFRPTLFCDLKRRLFAVIHPSSPPMMN